MGGGGGGGNSVVQTNLVPTYIPGFQGWTETYLNQAYDLMVTRNYYAYPNPTYALRNADEEDGIEALATRGLQGAAIELDGKILLEALYNGDYLNTNPKLAAEYNAKIEELLEEFDDDVMPAIQNAHVFAFGSSEHNTAEARAAKAMMKKINELVSEYYEDFKRERGLRDSAVPHATPYGLQCIRDMEMLRQAGVYEREYQQGILTDAWERWNEDNIMEVRNLDILGNAVRTVLGTYRSTTMKYYGPPKIAQIAGAALAGLSIASMFSGSTLNPYAATAAGKVAPNVGPGGFDAGTGGWDPDAEGPQ